METNSTLQPKNLMIQKILWLLIITAIGFGIGYLFHNIPAFTIGGAIGGSMVFFYKKKN